MVRMFLYTVISLCGLLVFLIVLFKWAPVPVTSFMIQERISSLAAGERSYSFTYQWVPVEKMSRNLQKAVIAAEDQRFADHYGFDFVQIQKVLDEREKAARSKKKSRKQSRGASTITQQVAKNLFLWPGQSYVRKGLEAGLTLLIELIWTKERILEVYLNIAQFGKGVWGVEAASRGFFKKPAAKLTPAEAALMAVSLPNPVIYSIKKPSKKMIIRQQWVLRYMNEVERPDSD